MSVADRPPRLGGALAWLDVANARLLRHPVWFVAAFLVIYGVDGSDDADFRQLASDPLALHPDLDRQFLHSSPLVYFVGHPIVRLIGAEAGFVVVSAAGFALLAWGIARLLRPLTADAASEAATVLLASPLLLVVTRWIGKPDPVLIGLYLLLVSAPRAAWLRTALAVLLVLCHREIATFVLIGHLVVHRRDWAAVLVGLALGHLAIVGYHHGLLPSPPGSRESYAGAHAPEILAGFIANPLAHLVFSLGWFWIFFAIALRRQRQLATMILLATIVAAGALTFDYTRVTALCALPIIVRVALQLAGPPPGLPRFLRRLPFPLLFLLQFQIEGAHHVRDSRWFDWYALQSPRPRPIVSRP